MEKSKVYFTKEITPTSLIKIYEALGVTLTGKVGIKISSGEKGSINYLKPELIKDLVQKLNGTIIECNTAYPGARNIKEEHMQVLEEHGFTSIAPVDIMDEDGEMPLIVTEGKHLTTDLVGSHITWYDSILNLAHFKGHAMGGFGGVIKNQSIGMASRNGKAQIHSVGYTTDPDDCWNHISNQDGFLESMAEAAKAVKDYFEMQNKPILYIDVMNNISVDCDCDANQKEPVMKDIGILASTDPVAVDQACIDLIWKSDDVGKDKLIKRIDSRNGRHILAYSEEIGLGNREYELINID